MKKIFNSNINYLKALEIKIRGFLFSVITYMSRLFENFYYFSQVF